MYFLVFMLRGVILEHCKWSEIGNATDTPRLLTSWLSYPLWSFLRWVCLVRMVEVIVWLFLSNFNIFIFSLSPDKEFYACGMWPNWNFLPLWWGIRSSLIHFTVYILFCYIIGVHVLRHFKILNDVSSYILLNF